MNDVQAFRRGWAVSFLKNCSKMASSYIIGELRKQTKDKQNAMEQHALRVLRDRRLKSDEELRNGAVRLIVALLPKTFPAVEALLSDSTSQLLVRSSIHSVLFTGSG
jgi:hypothetical protein